MQTCGKCRRARNQGAIYCTGCGSRFPDSSEQGRYPADGHDARAGDPAGKYRDPGLPAVKRSRRPLRLVPVAAAAIIVAAGSWLLIGHSGRQSGGRELGSSAGTANTNGQTASTAGPSPGGSTVAVAAGAGQDPGAPSVAGFLDQYFAAINSHDYQAYAALLGPDMQQDMTAEQFDSGYRSTADSGETLAGISTAANGDTVATVTFTSHQDPADSVDHKEGCTDWKISLFLEQASAGYLIDQPPSSYHAAHQPCP
jgi:hypothetical protein